MERSNEDWSCLPGPIIDRVIVKLRTFGRWKRAVLDLRFLNKHWCKQMDTWITHICPTRMYMDDDNDIQRLSKFVNLRKLKLTPFLNKWDSGRLVPKALRHLTCLRSLSHLTDLELRGQVHENIRSCPSGCFQNVTSIVFDDAGFCEGKSLALLHTSPIHKLTFIGTINRKYMKYPWINSLRSLEFVTDSVRQFFVESITHLVALTSLSIISMFGQALAVDNVKKLSRLTSLVSLHLPDSELTLPLWLTTLSNLESLGLTISDFVTNEERLWTLLESFHCLESLSLSHTLIKKESFLKFNEKAKKLKSLECLNTLGMEDDGSLSLLTELTRLVIHLNETTTSLRSLVELSSLQELSLRGFSRLPSIFPETQASRLKNLAVLEIHWIVSDHVVEEISLIQSLKKVCLLNCATVSVNAILEFRNLPNLSELCLVGVSFENPVKPKRQFRTPFENLSLLCFIRAPYRSTPYWIDLIFHADKYANCLEEFWNSSCIGQKTWGPKLYRRA